MRRARTSTGRCADIRHRLSSFETHLVAPSDRQQASQLRGVLAPPLRGISRSRSPKRRRHPYSRSSPSGTRSKPASARFGQPEVLRSPTATEQVVVAGIRLGDEMEASNSLAGVSRHSDGAAAEEPRSPRADQLSVQVQEALRAARNQLPHVDGAPEHVCLGPGTRHPHPPSTSPSRPTTHARSERLRSLEQCRESHHACLQKLRARWSSKLTSDDGLSLRVSRAARLGHIR